MSLVSGIYHSKAPFLASYDGHKLSGKTKSKSKIRQRVLACLAKTNLNDWERRFCNSIKSRKSLSPKQWQCLYSIEQKKDRP